MNPSISRSHRLAYGVPLAIALLPGSCTTPPLPEVVPPETRVVRGVGDIFLENYVPDPYRWLEDQDGADTQQWTAAQNAVTETYLGSIPSRETLRARLTELWNYERFGTPERAGDMWFFSYNDGLQNQAVIYKSTTPEGPGQVFLDPNTLSDDGTVALSGMSFSRDGSHLAYSVSDSGSDWREWRVFDTATGEHLPDVVRWSKFSTATWLPDGSGFLYSRYAEPEAGEAFEATNTAQVYTLHTLGTSQEDDVAVFADPDHPERSTSATVSDDGEFLVLTTTSGTDTRNLISILDLDDLDQEPVPVITEFEASYQFLGNDGRHCYFFTDQSAPRGRVIRIDLDHPEQFVEVEVPPVEGETVIDEETEDTEEIDLLEPVENWQTMVPEAIETLESARIVGGRLVMLYLRDAHHVLLHSALDGSDSRIVELPGLGSVAGLTGKREDRESFFQFQSFTSPPSVFALDLETDELWLIHEPTVAFDRDQFETKQVAFQSKDGTRVPMFIVHKKGVDLYGDNPTYLYGYGGFNISLKPDFKPERIAWLEMGGIYAQVTLRGGGEYGREWHEGGMLHNKQNVFDDFVAAASYLTRNEFTRKEKLAIGGRSNGGLLVGAALTQNPELFGAAIPEVGVLDMLRYHKFTIGHAWIPEYGNAENPTLFETLRAYSPLHNIENGTDYPATLVMTGDHDDRVLPGHSYKFAATLQRAQVGSAPILLRIETDAGHGGGKPTTKRIAEAADRWAFLVRELNIR